MTKKVNEISIGDYRKKAAMQKAQSQMGAMFGKPEEREKNIATFNKREKGLNRLKARDEKSRAAAQAAQTADLVARLPELKAEYEKMKAEYKALGGSNWQYADREQNLSPGERKARDMEGPMNNLWRSISAAEKAQGQQGLNEFAPDGDEGGDDESLHKYARMWYQGDLNTQHQVEKILDRMGWEIGEIESEEGGCFVVKSGDEHGKSYIGFAPEDLSEGAMKEWKKSTKAPIKPRNFVAKNATTGGAGAHKDKKKDAKQGKAKHKKKPELAETATYERRLNVLLETKLLIEQFKQFKK